MNTLIRRLLEAHRFALTVMLSALLLAGAEASAQCPPDVITAGLQLPLGITQSNQGNLLVSEAGTPAPNTGRVSIVGLDGTRRTLLDGLPSGTNDIGDLSGPSGLFMRGRTLYVVIGQGDSTIPGGFPGPPTELPNPNPSSPIFSSVLAVHFSAKAEKTTDGFTLTFADQQALAAGQKVTLFSSSGDRATVELVVNVPDFTPDPLPFFPANVRHSNPYDLVVVGDQLYVTDGGQNSVWQADITTGTFSTLATFAPIPNPLFNPTPPPPPVGGPFIEAVPTGITYADGQLLVTLFRGFPFVPGTSVVEQVDPLTGAHAPLITGRTAAIDVLALEADGDTDYLVLQFASGPFLSGPGLLLRFESPSDPPTVIANCLITPSSMTLDEKTGTLYITELATGRVVAISLAPNPAPKVKAKAGAKTLARKQLPVNLEK